MRSSPDATPAATPHVLVIPKWWPNSKDPQLGDFIRKQIQAVSSACKVTVLLVEPTDEQQFTALEHLEADGLKVVRTRYRACTGLPGPWRRSVNFVRYWRAGMAGWKALRSTRGIPDLVHVHILVRPALLAYWLKRIYRVPYIISEQSSEYLDGSYLRKGRLFHWINERLFRSAASVSAVSGWLGDGLVRHGLCERYEVVPNVIPGLDRPLPAPGLPGDLLVVADLVDRTKNVSGVIKALAVARRSAPELRLNVIGDGPDRGALEDLAHKEGVSDRVVFLGRLPNTEVLDHMATCGAVVINSNVETFSVVTGEALAMGKPVVATRCGGPQGFVTPTNGILINVGDHDALVAAMLTLTHTADRYDPDEIRASVRDRFSPAVIAQKFMALYQRSLATEA